MFSKMHSRYPSLLFQTPSNVPSEKSEMPNCWCTGQPPTQYCSGRVQPLLCFCLCRAFKDREPFSIGKMPTPWALTCPDAWRSDVWRTAGIIVISVRVFGCCQKYYFVLSGCDCGMHIYQSYGTQRLFSTPLSLRIQAPPNTSPRALSNVHRCMFQNGTLNHMDIF